MPSVACTALCQQYLDTMQQVLTDLCWCDMIRSGRCDQLTLFAVLHYLCHGHPWRQLRQPKRDGIVHAPITRVPVVNQRLTIEDTSS